MPLAKNKWRRHIAVLLCAMLIFSTAFSITAFADNAVVTSGTMYSYFQTFSSKGQWVDIQTPSHWITGTGEVAYCLQTSKDSPYNSGYHTVEGSDYYDQRTLTGLYAILENGYPVTTDGFTDEEARYATANAIRFWCAENGCEGMPAYLSLKINGDWIRGKYGYEDLYNWCLGLVQKARDQATSSPSTGSISFSITAFAAPVDEATIDTSRTGSLDIYKYDLTNAEKDGVWDSSYVSTGVKDENGVEAVLGDPARVSALNANGNAYGYAIKGVEFTYVKVADIRTFTESEDGAEHIEVLYGIAPTEQNNAFLSAIGISTEDRYAPADEVVDGMTVYYYRSDVLIDGLKASLDANSIAVKNALERYAHDNHGVAMTETDAYGHTSAANLPLGLYLLIETRVPEMVTDTTAPFLVSLPMTSVDGSNASDGGTRWIYDVTLYPKNLTGIPTLEKTLREDKADTGKNSGSTSDITDGYAHTGTASAGDVIDYQIISTLPSITSAASYLTDYTFIDTLSKGITYNKGDVMLEFFKDESCTDLVASWAEPSDRFLVSYNTTSDGASVMTISMTASGLAEINSGRQVYLKSSMVNSGYSDCTLRITYKATVNSDASVTYGDAGNPNDVVLTWKRTNSSYYDTLVDDCHVYLYGIDMTKQFSDGRGDFSKVQFIVHNDTDGYFLVGKLNEAEGVWYVTDHVTEEKDATHFIPTKDGKLILKGLEDDTYTWTEVQTANGYTLLKNSIKVVISQAESETLCGIYGTDVLGLIQNDPRYASVDPGLYHNMPQKQLAHKLLTASATVDSNKVNMAPDGSSANAFVPFTVINTRGFDLPQTGSYGNWMFPVAGLSMLTLCVVGIVALTRKSKKKAQNT